MCVCVCVCVLFYHIVSVCVNFVIWVYVWCLLVCIFADLLSIHTNFIISIFYVILFGRGRGGGGGGGKGELEGARGGLFPAESE